VRQRLSREPLGLSVIAAISRNSREHLTPERLCVCVLFVPELTALPR
jgi:hypothetical protein